MYKNELSYIILQNILYIFYDNGPVFGIYLIIYKEEDTYYSLLPIYILPEPPPLHKFLYNNKNTKKYHWYSIRIS